MFLCVFLWLFLWFFLPGSTLSTSLSMVQTAPQILFFSYDFPMVFLSKMAFPMGFPMIFLAGWWLSSTPMKKIRVRQLGWWKLFIPNWMEKQASHVPVTTNQIHYIYQSPIISHYRFTTYTIIIYNHSLCIPWFSYGFPMVFLWKILPSIDFRPDLPPWSPSRIATRWPTSWPGSGWIPGAATNEKRVRVGEESPFHCDFVVIYGDLWWFCGDLWWFMVIQLWFLVIY